MRAILDKVKGFLLGSNFNDGEFGDDENHYGEPEDVSVGGYNYRDQRSEYEDHNTHAHHDEYESRSSRRQRDENENRSSRRQREEYEERAPRRHRDDFHSNQTNTRRTSSRSNDNVVEMPNRNLNAHSKVHISYPKSIEDSAIICELIRDNTACIINLENVDTAVAQRIADFIGGANHTLKGSIIRISNSIFIVSPAQVEVTSEMKEDIKNGRYPFSWVSNQ
jgi:cell division inhibitor SepF